MRVIESILNDNIFFTKEQNKYCFIKDNNDRPEWSVILDNYIVDEEIDLNMKKRYINQRQKTYSNGFQYFFEHITESNGVIVDLASGPSGYFSPVFDFLKDDSIFIATDACKSIINAHVEANNDNRFYVFDIDLDKSLPFKDNSVDAFCGNLLNNINNYRELLSEVYRCLKPGGKLAVIELFFEKDSLTYEYLVNENAVYSSVEQYTDYCKSIGFNIVGSQIKEEIIGKIDPNDLLPIGENDKCLETIVLLEK
ncbi:class I SAM-dependent methyltransferase [Sedimentibacter sp. zth1]|uniref:class I SAM-dependent methyltransferase n=1 Tax=Sedimentibacter sp. zth1 TaxID=2816908 RepID=UPI001A92AF0F|nr:class I SAM-dependent methyltransferase [Sedimentibacter sp. zth1]QSX04672.1 class I SAM-dependent methyltransferase [Sedimentibacter sp. zth1]